MKKIVVKVVFQIQTAILYSKWTLFNAQLNFNCLVTLFIIIKLANVY